MTSMTVLHCRTSWVLPLLLVFLGWGCAGAYSGHISWDSGTNAGSNGGESDDGFMGIVVGDSGVATGDSVGGAGDSGAPGCQPSCAGKACGDPDGCGGTCQVNCNTCTPACTGKLCGDGDGCGGTCNDGSGCCTPSCAGKLCGAGDGCGGTCNNGSGCCTPSCAAKSCGGGDGCGGTCKIGSGCYTSCGGWQAVSPDDPWDASDPNYDGERGCNGSLVKDFGRVSTEAACRTKCEKVAASCCSRDHRGEHKSCRAYDGKVIAVGSCTGCTAASCK
jgi:hypothetical protein